MRIDFFQGSTPAPFAFRPLPSQPMEKIGVAAASNRPKMTLPTVTKNKEQALFSR